MNRINLFALGVLILASSCSGLKPLTISEIESVNMAGMKGSAVLVKATFRVQNPNKYGFTVRNADMDVFLNNSSIGKAKIDGNIRIPRKSDKSYTVNIEANLAQMMFGGLMNMGKSGASKVRLKGEIRASKFFFFRKKFPVDVEKSVNLSK